MIRDEEFVRIVTKLKKTTQSTELLKKRFLCSKPTVQALICGTKEQIRTLIQRLIQYIYIFEIINF